MACDDYTDSSAQTGDSGFSTTSYPLGFGCKIDAGHPLVGYTLNSITATAYISGSVTGNPDIYCYHWDGAGDPQNTSDYRAVSDSHPSSDFVGSWTERKWTFSSPAVVQAGDYISYVLPSGQSGLSFFQETNEYTTNTSCQQFRGGWSALSGKGWTFTAEYNCNGTPTGTSVTIPPPVAMVQI
jgi:hypothetical protein